MDATPSRAQSIRIKNTFLKDKVTFDKLEKTLSEEKSNQHEQITLNKNNIESVLPPELLKRDKRYIEEYIIEAINYYKKQKIKDIKFYSEMEYEENDLQGY